MSPVPGCGGNTHVARSIHLLAAAAVLARVMVLLSVILALHKQDASAALTPSPPPCGDSLWRSTQCSCCADLSMSLH